MARHDTTIDSSDAEKRDLTALTHAGKPLSDKHHIFENVWQSSRTRQNRQLELTSAPHTYSPPGRKQIAVKVIDIFGNDTTTRVPVHVG